MAPEVGKPLERYEDEYGDERDVYEVAEGQVAKFLATGNFKEVAR
jgi:hypothetical protein